VVGLFLADAPTEGSMKRIFFVCLFLCLTTTFLLPQSVSHPLAEATQKPPVSFAKAVDYGPGAYFPDFIAIGDVNGDGIPDLVVASECEIGGCYGGEVSVLLGNGDGTFQAAVAYSSGGIDAASVAIADLNGDGIPDLVVASDQCQGCTGSISVLLGNGDGTFQAAVFYNSGFTGATSVAIGDVNGDGIPDLIAAGGSDVGVLLGNGDGTFQPGITYGSGGYGAISVVVADVNGDGHLDLIVASVCMSSGCDGDSPGGVGVLLGNGDGTFQAAATYGSGGFSTDSLAVADVNGDGIPDLVAANAYECDGCVNGGVGVLLGNGDGTFEEAVSYSAGWPRAYSVAIGDVNGDGYSDLVVTGWDGKRYASGEVSVLLGNGNGTFGASVEFGSNGANPLSVAVGDVNGDHRLDLVVANECDDTRYGTVCNKGYGEVAVLLNEFTATTTTKITSSHNPSQVNQSVTFTATVTSSSSVPNGSMVTFHNGATVIGTGTTTNGVATLTASFSTAGKFTIKASYPGDAFHKASSGTVKQVVDNTDSERR
jgi:hypothetical protein